MEPIDFVVTWVDGNDPGWLEEKRNALGMAESSGDSDDSRKRYMDLGTLRYWFRGVERFAPWVRNVYFVTWGHVPDWLDCSNEKLVIMNHRDYIPGQYLPTFNSHTIENNFHRIPGLSERFVYFNDDVFLLQKTEPEDFFVGSRPRDILAFQPVIANEKDHVMPYVFLNNACVLARHFKKREGVLAAPEHYFHIGYPPLYFFYNALELFFPSYTGFFTHHGPSPLRKSTIRHLWEIEYEVLDTTCKHRVRSRGDVSQYLFREWQKLSGEFVPTNIPRDLRHIPITDDRRQREALYRTIAKQKAKYLCLFEQYTPDPRKEERIRRALCRAFEEALPEPSSFEKTFGKA